MTSGHNIVSVTHVKKYYKLYRKLVCNTCGINLLEYVNMNNHPIHRTSSSTHTIYRCDTCYERLFGGVSLRKDYPEEVITI
jgi:hypothetical protein